MTDGKKPETPRVDAYVAAQPDEKDMHELCESYNGLLYLARELEQALALRGEPVADKLTELAEQVLEVADYLNDACNNAGEIAGSECVDPLMSIHGDLLGLLAAPISGERASEFEMDVDEYLAALPAVVSGERATRDRTLQQCQDELVDQGALDIKICWAPGEFTKEQRAEDLRQFLNACLNGESTLEIGAAAPVLQSCEQRDYPGGPIYRFTHSTGTSGSTAAVSGERVREALDELDWIIDQERYTFAECSLAEEIMARVKRARTAIHGEKNG